MVRKLLLSLVVILLTVYNVTGTDLYVVYEDTLNGDDTTVTSRTDTVYTPSMKLFRYGDRADYVCFGITYIDPDTNWADDSVFVGYQLSRNGRDWTTIYITDTINPGASTTWTLSPVVETLLGQPEGVYSYLRGMAIMWDSLPAAADIQGNVYTTGYRFWAVPQW